MPIEIAFDILLRQAPPGRTYFSVEPVPECAGLSSCNGARWSPFYESWVRQEDEETGRARYRVIAEQMREQAEALTCMDVAGVVIDRCVPFDGVLRKDKSRRWGPRVLMAATSALITLESGLREDVQVGRGSAKQRSPDGGQGRGPSLEVCLAQLHPRYAYRYADRDPELTPRAEAGDRAAKQALAERLLGTAPEAVGHCLRTGMRTLIASHAYCTWSAPKTPWDYAMYSLYGTGTTCISGNQGKTMARTSLFRKLNPMFQKAKLE
jgi:hypothetical protein